MMVQLINVLVEAVQLVDVTVADPLLLAMATPLVLHATEVGKQRGALELMVQFVSLPGDVSE